MNAHIAEAGQATRFQRGRSGNPGGRPKRKPISDELRRLLQEKTSGSAYTNAHMIAWDLVQRAQSGDVAAAKLVLEYVEGKPTQPVDLQIRETAQQLAAT